MAEALLTLDDVRAGYGDAVVLDGITFEVRDGGSLALLGRNGVGKSTLLLTIMGYTLVRRGTIRWRGRDITRLPPHLRARRCGGLPVMSFPRQITLPRAIVVKPMMVSSSVDLPTPLRPSTARLPCSGTSSETPSSTIESP